MPSYLLFVYTKDSDRLKSDFLQSYHIAYNNQNIHYLKAGKGPAVVLLHGLGETAACWSNQTDYLIEKGFQLIIPDFPGSGHSTMDDKINLTLEAMAKMMHVVIQSENIDTLTMIGHSMGGYVALQYLELFPQRLTALGLLHSTALADNEEKKSIRKKSISFIEENGIEMYLDISFQGLFKDSNKRMASKLIDQAKGIPAATIIKYHQAIMERDEKILALEKSDIPILLIAGKHDNAVPYSDSLRMSHLAPLTYFHTLQSSAHMGHWEESDWVNKILGDFLTREWSVY